MRASSLRQLSGAQDVGRASAANRGLIPGHDHLLRRASEHRERNVRGRGVRFPAPRWRPPPTAALPAPKRRPRIARNRSPSTLSSISEFCLSPSATDRRRSIESGRPPDEREAGFVSLILGSGWRCSIRDPYDHGSADDAVSHPVRGWKGGASTIDGFVLADVEALCPSAIHSPQVIDDDDAGD